MWPNRRDQNWSSRDVEPVCRVLLWLGLIHSNIDPDSHIGLRVDKTMVSIRYVYVIWYEKYLESVSGMRQRFSYQDDDW